MEEISFKPKFSADLTSLGITLLLLLLTIGIPISIFVGIIEGISIGVLIFIIGLFLGTGLFVLISIPIILSKIFLTYYITQNNEIIIEYSFLSKTTKVYRIDQLTSINYKQNWIQKRFGLGTVSFDVFGTSGVAAQNQQQNQQVILPQFSSVKEHKYIFEHLCEELQITKETPLYKTKPKTSPRKTGFFITLILLITASIIIYYVEPFFAIIPLIFLLISTPLFIISIKRLTHTQYEIAPKSTLIKYNYFLSESITKIPISKITNIKSSKNAISHTLFGVGKTLIYTGGLSDPVFPGLEDYTSFTKYLSKLSKGEKVKQHTTNTNENKKEENETPEFTTTTSRVYLLKYLISYIPFLLLITLPLYWFDFALYANAILIIFSLLFLLQYFYWKSLKYEFYTYKIIKYSGIITTVSAELHYKNLKYLSLKRSMILDRLAKTGTIYLYTAGSTSVDKAIICVKKYDEIYDSFEEILEKE